APIRLPVLVNTLFAWELLEAKAELRPLPVARIATLQRALFSAFGANCAEPALAEGVRTRLHGALAGWAERLDPGVRPAGLAYLDDCIERMRCELGTIDADVVSPRTLTSLLVIGY
ncbi:MAG: DUF6178 family protein, partial [Deltaproteobacteria bacterium]|nr:DUF6178 family protein [Deltaproteobacteria bacterium]